MRKRQDVDPQLHVLRTFGRTLESRAATDFEYARFQVFDAFEHGDEVKAHKWLVALSAAVLAASDGSSRPDLVKMATNAIREIGEACGEDAKAQSAAGVRR